MWKHEPYGIKSSELYVKISESLSIWTGNNKEAWLDSRRLLRRRTLLKCERKAQENPTNPDTFYIASCDIGRYSANTAITIIKVLPQEQEFKKNVVYVEVMHGANYITEQAPRIKKIIELFHPREVVIDGNGRIFLAHLSGNALD